MAFTTMAIIALSAYAASKTAADIIKAKREKAAAEQAAKDSAATAAPSPVTPPAAPTTSMQTNTGLAQTAAERQRKRSAAGSTLLTGRNTPGGSPAGVTMPRQLLGAPASGVWSERRP